MKRRLFRKKQVKDKLHECWVTITRPEMAIYEILPEFEKILELVTKESERNNGIRITRLNQECWDSWTTGETYEQNWCIDMMLDKEAVLKMDELTDRMKYMRCFCRPLILD